jgi:hypothetical protein
MCEEVHLEIQPYHLAEHLRLLHFWECGIDRVQSTLSGAFENSDLCLHNSASTLGYSIELINSTINHTLQI